MGCLVGFLLLSCLVEISELNANSVDPDQMPHSARLIWVYTVCQSPFYGTLGINGLTSSCALCCIGV